MACLVHLEHDYHVSFTPEELAKGEVYYNYRMTKDGFDELPGLSVFVKGEDGQIFHTYSCYARGLDMVNGAYHWLDLVPKGRNERDHKGPNKTQSETVGSQNLPLEGSCLGPPSNSTGS